ncbi:NAD(P)H-dependent oxidoreductase [Flavobacterium hercynium]|uniref:NAD(P)H-dependent oxidoreductase n=1 Tax=Flavobacterium hercynium TaxID=387094 RepID=A0A226H6N5_9FLAO|nr:NAD(P)H-dependent oxidoreductase [Flavobacterium hercynium]OXA89969.1 NAD(P)H-dependent oxidoreductase [Flavobacterium hercynium]SMP13975.1 Nitroreductase [Flavobacterium hercynium]
MSLIEDLQWRYATKKMNGNIVPQEKVDYIIEATRLSPSSSGLQPYEVFVVTNADLLGKIKAIGWDQSQITDCSHLLVFAAWDGYSLEKIEKVFARTLEERGLPADTMDDYKARLWGMYEPLSQEWHANHAARQAYIALGIAMAAAAEQKVDATPMEGFLPEELDKILGLKEKGLKSAVILPLGYRDEANDWLVNMKKVRTPKEIFITEVK